MKKEKSKARQLTPAVFMTVICAMHFSAQQASASLIPDLIISMMELSESSPDCQSPDKRGTVAVTVKNIGMAPVASSFEVAVFEDSNGNGKFDQGVDPIFGKGVFEPLAAEGTQTVTIDIAGTVKFSGNILYAFTDSENAIAESDETNNTYHTGMSCQLEPVIGTFDPVVKWAWTQSSVLPDHLNVMMTPGIIDLNGDGVPDVVFGTATYSLLAGTVKTGVLRALNGKDGSELFTVTADDLMINPTWSVATGDIDLDGKSEIIACDSSGKRLIAFEHDGVFKWRGPELADQINWGAPALADLNGDGKPEIIVGRQVLNNEGTLLWTATGTSHPIPIVADINLDGIPEIIAGNTVYTASGNILWKQIWQMSGKNAIGNFDADAFPEIVIVAAGKVWVLEHDGTVKWGPMTIPGGGTGGPPTVADFDNDKEPEIGVAGTTRYVVFETDGSIKWEATTQDISSAATGSSAFDFDGDGAAEVVYRDETTFRIFNGKDGSVLFEMPMSSCTWYEYPLVADVDADGKAEIVGVANDNCGMGPQRGVYVIGNKSNSWVSTRKIWNQHSYHITNINEDGTIPAVEKKSWLRFNSYRQNIQIEGSPLALPDLTASFVKIDQSVCPAAINLVARIGNGGSKTVPSPVNVAFYDGNPENGGLLLGVVQTSQELKPGQHEDVILKVTPALLGARTIYAVADDDGTGKVALEECNKTNNQCSKEIEFFCNRPPVCADAYPDQKCLWPPDHKFTDIHILGIKDADNDPVNIVVTSITSDEPTATDSTSGGRKHAPDASGIGTNTSAIRTERAENGDGRVYWIQFEANDGRGGTCRSSVSVNAPLDQKYQAVDSGQHYDATTIN